MDEVLAMSDPPGKMLLAPAVRLVYESFHEFDLTRRLSSAPPHALDAPDGQIGATRACLIADAGYLTNKLV